MTRNEFFYIIDLRKEFEFVVDGERFNITYGTDNDGRDCIYVGKVLQIDFTYHSFNELWAECKIRNYFLREIIGEL